MATVTQGTKNKDGSVNNYNPNTGARLTRGQVVTVNAGGAGVVIVTEFY